MSSIDRAHLGRDVGGGGGFLNPKNLKFERFHILKNSWKWRIEFLNFPLLKSVCTRKTYLYIRLCFCLSLHLQTFFHSSMFVYRTMFSSFPNSIENHAHYRVSTSVCHLWGPEKRVSCHPLTGLIWAGMWGGGAFWTRKISNLNVFTYWKIAENDGLNFWTFLCWSLFAQERHIYLYMFCFCLSLYLKIFFHSSCSYLRRCFSLPNSTWYLNRKAGSVCVCVCACVYVCV